MGQKYVIGVDFGTLSARALLCDAASGEVCAESVADYAHGVMDTALPDGTPLPADFALQHPADYLDALSQIISGVISDGRVASADIVGVGIDFTSCTILPVHADGTPLCFDDCFQGEPHAYVKLWKHHAAQAEADALNAVARERGERWLSVYGGKTSSEWMFPKVWEILREAPHIYDATDRFVEAGDFLTWYLTGTESHGAALAGYKALWNEGDGYPSPAFFAALDPRLTDIIGTKIGSAVNTERIAGTVSERGAALTGLPVGCAVAIAMPDAHAALPALGAVDAGTLVMIMGTSTCHIVNAERALSVPGICGYVKDGVIKGLYTYEAGHACVGDCFDRFVKSYVPEAYTSAARSRGISLHALLREKVQGEKAGESGLLCLPWFNGNRSVLVDAELSGMLLGLSLQTTPEQIYRALLEATAYATRLVVENYETHGIKVDTIRACGGIARKDAMMMQIYADVLGRPVHVASTTQAGALGSAVYAAVAGGVYKTLAEASAIFARPDCHVYIPDPEAHATYNKLFAEYKRLHDYFGRGENDVMKHLREIKKG